MRKFFLICINITTSNRIFFQNLKMTTIYRGKHAQFCKRYNNVKISVKLEISLGNHNWCPYRNLMPVKRKKNVFVWFLFSKVFIK